MLQKGFFQSKTKNVNIIIVSILIRLGTKFWLNREFRLFETGLLKMLFLVENGKSEKSKSEFCIFEYF